MKTWSMGFNSCKIAMAKAYSFTQNTLCSNRAKTTSGQLFCGTPMARGSLEMELPDSNDHGC